MNVVQLNGKSFLDAKSAHLKKQLELIVKYLGRETMEKWYIDYAMTYSPEIMNKIQRDPVHGSVVVNSHLVGRAAINGKSDSGAIQAIGNAYTTADYCGTNCGAYCSCNSNGVCS